MINIFIAYSREDLNLKKELKKFLSPLLRGGGISTWDDDDIEAGEVWDTAIKDRLKEADIILLLVSADSLASEYFYGKEVAISIERHEKNEAIVIPVILRPSDWKYTPLGKLEVTPENGVSVSEWPTRDQAWQDVISRLRRVVDNIKTKKRKDEEIVAERRKLFNTAIQAAGHLMDESNWKEAKTALLGALTFYNKGFEPTESMILGQIKETEEFQKKLEEKKKSLKEEKDSKKEFDQKTSVQLTQEGQIDKLELQRKNSSKNEYNLQNFTDESFHHNRIITSIGFFYDDLEEINKNEISKIKKLIELVEKVIDYEYCSLDLNKNWQAIRNLKWANLSGLCKKITDIVLPYLEALLRACKKLRFSQYEMNVSDQNKSLTSPGVGFVIKGEPS